MSFAGYKDKIELGDTVILFININNMHAIKVESTLKNKRGEIVEYVFQTTYGALKVAGLVGKRFGTKVQLSKGWAYVLYPTPELWTQTLPHRTQIIYTPDISLILMLLDLRPGHVVIESGTGSGSLTHALIRQIKPKGHVHTYDFHEVRSKVASDEFADHGLKDFVTVRHRDVCADGFGPEVAGSADAVFLDLPHPWLAIPYAVRAFRSQGGRLVSFSPCIEQVQRTCASLRAAGFLDLQTFECLQKELQVTNWSMPILNLDPNEDPTAAKKDTTRFLTGVPPPTLPGHTGYITAATLPPGLKIVSKENNENMESENASTPEQTSSPNEENRRNGNF